MLDKDLIEISISRVIPAQKWRIIRLLTKVEDFPQYIPCVKDASLIQKSHHKMKTKWKIEVEKIPISWIEEDTLALRENSIYFNSIEGDLEEFRGKWEFLDHPEGTEVKVNVYLRVGIPAIKDFADTYVKKLLTKNFESILEALEKRLVSVKYASYRKGDIEKIAGFGIVWHLYNFKHFERCLKSLNPEFKMPSQEFLSQLLYITPSFKLYDILNFKSKMGKETNGCFILATITPDMMEKDMWMVFSKVIKACKIAEKHGVGIVSLGGFTSIVLERIGQKISDEVDVPVTTGNTFTAAMAIDGVLKAAEILNMDISSAKVTIVGGTGDIGSACARVLVDKVRRLTITGRNKANLRQISKELRKRSKAEIIATTDNESAVRDADIIIAAASVSASILKIDWFKPGSIICDVGYPKNIPSSTIDREDILIFSGGLSKSPTPISFPLDIGLPSPDVIYGCFAEAIILALEKRYENFSSSLINITPEKIDEIRNLGKKHGFEVSDFYWADRLIDESMIDKVREAVNV